MSQRIIEASENDKNIRAEMTKLFKSANSEIMVIAGELTLLHFKDVHDAYKNARERGVRIRVYASDASKRNLEALEQIGVEVKIGKKGYKDHYVLIDGTIIFKVAGRPHNPPSINYRTGVVWTDDPKTAAEIQKMWEGRVLNLKRKWTLGAGTSIMVAGLYASVLMLRIPAEAIVMVLIPFAILLSYGAR